MPKRKLPKPGPQQPLVTRIERDKYERGKSGIYIIRDGRRIRVGRVRKKGK